MEVAEKFPVSIYKYSDLAGAVIRCFSISAYCMLVAYLNLLSYLSYSSNTSNMSNTAALNKEYFE